MTSEKQKQIINILYIFLILSTVLSFVPIDVAQIMSLLIILTVLICAYYYKKQDDVEGLLHNHMTYMINTIWIGGSFLVIGMILAALIVFLKGDHTVVHNAMEGIMGGQTPTEEMFHALMMEYMSINRDLLVKATIPTVGPAIAYLVYRIAHGYKRGMNGYRISKPKSWL